ncbi:YfhO family protein [Schleiferilactobacillus harbinensis]|uniref:YfhO family protein n=1 Tax=Schleiferilactobacillus harbinensis TaxID=304207 RepID=UPI001AAFD561|nr:YfhO family protein [Schleiferilactobacillus harbinensis]MBO3092385.1 YfhO family protein [Schleiferilactobacillus harbinensis]
MRYSSRHHRTSPRWPLVWSFAVPFLFIIGYFAVQRVWPLGNQSVMTVDLGQQYIDFFAYFKKTLLAHPETFFYSFSKGLGGEMIGTFAYYLLSPLNFLLFLFPGTSLSVGIWLLMALKLGLAGLFACVYLRQPERHLAPAVQAALAVSYGLCAYLIVNHYNVMWLDGVYLLPLLLVTLEWQRTARRIWAYPLLLAVTFIVNYYIGYMIALFLVLYWVWYQSQFAANLRTWLRQGVRFAWTSLLSAGLSLFILLPTLFALSDSKGTYTVKAIDWTIEYNPLKLLPKMVSGAYSFDQMSSGQANIYTGMIVLLGVILYFFNRWVPWQEKIVAGGISLFLLASLFFQPFDLLWHGFQFPVWYPYRFSFVVSLWGILLTARVWPLLPQFRAWQGWLLLIPGIVIVGYSAWQLPKLEFIHWPAILFTGAFAVAAVCLVALHDRSWHWWPLALLLCVTLEMLTNGVLSLNQLSYISQSDYANYTNNLQAAVSKIQKTSPEPFYRIGKTFERTKDDAMQTDFFGGSHFNSMMEPRQPNLYDRLGLPAGDGQISYTNGTLITDAVLDMRYYLQDTKSYSVLDSHDLAGHPMMFPNAYRPDLAFYDHVATQTMTATYRNPYALSLVYAGSDRALKHVRLPNYPLSEQEALMNELTGSQDWHSLFIPILHPTITTSNIKKDDNETISGTFYRSNKLKPATVTYSFIASSNDPYYVTFGNNMPIKDMTIRVNGREVKQYDSFRSPVAFNLAAHHAGRRVTLSFTFSNNDSVSMDGLAFYRFDLAEFEKMDQQLQNQAGEITNFKQDAITATVTTTKTAPTVYTSIPASPGWQVLVDGQPQKTKQLMNTFVAFTPKKTGRHTVQIRYVAPGWRVGVTGSLLALLLWGLVVFFDRKHYWSAGSPVALSPSSTKWWRKA